MKVKYSLELAPLQNGIVVRTAFILEPFVHFDETRGFKLGRMIREQPDAPIKIKFELTVTANGSLLPLSYY